jgi:Scavenger receptor cysteine-rich domain.
LKPLTQPTTTATVAATITVTTATSTISTTAAPAITTSVTKIRPVSPTPAQNVPVLRNPSGQVLRLRGGPGPWEGYVEVQDPSSGWGLVCDKKNSWTIVEATVVCHQLGYER